MKILYVHLYDVHTGVGGAAHVVLDLARVMKEKFQEDISAAVNPGMLSRELQKFGIPVTDIPFSKWRILEMTQKLGAVINQFRPHIVHSHHRYTSFVADLFFKKKSRVIHTQHVLTKNKSLVFRYGHLATAVSESVRKNLISYYGVPPERVVTVRNAVSLRPPDPLRLQELQKAYRHEEGRTLAFCVGRLDEQKGHRYLIEAVSQLPSVYRQRIKILLAGAGGLADSLRRQVMRQGLAEFFVFLGYTTEVSEFLSLSDFLILPSLWEGLPLSVLEAYSAGKAVIATDIPGTQELVQSGLTGLLVPPRDAKKLSSAIRYAMDHPDEIQKMGERARGVFQQFSFNEMATRYHALYEKVMEEPVSK